MGNFEKLSVLVIGVIIVMILVVALYTWTDDPAGEDVANTNSSTTLPPDLTVDVPGRDSPSDLGVNPWEEIPDDLPSRDVQDEPRTDDDLPPVDRPVVEDEPEVEETTARQYTVKDGDTLGGISLAVYGTTKYWQEIARLNDVDPMKLRKDMTLILPDIESAAPPNKPGDASVAVGAPKPGSSYKVRNGDTIQKISQAAYRTIERWPDIWFANMERLSSPEALPVGLEIEIPN